MIVVGFGTIISLKQWQAVFPKTINHGKLNSKEMQKLKPAELNFYYSNSDFQYIFVTMGHTQTTLPGGAFAINPKLYAQDSQALKDWLEKHFPQATTPRLMLFSYN